MNDLLIGWVMPDLERSYKKQEPWVQLCEICKVNPVEEFHHCIIHRMKGHPELDTPHNLQGVCRNCHKYANGRKNREYFWAQQCRRFGEDVMREWLDNLALKDIPIF